MIIEGQIIKTKKNNEYVFIRQLYTGDIYKVKKSAVSIRKYKYYTPVVITGVADWSECHYVGGSK